jgi:hypothetical protein
MVKKYSNGICNEVFTGRGSGSPAKPQSRRGASGKTNIYSIIGALCHE